MDKKIVNNYGSFDVVFVKGEGALLFDAEGKRYIDFIAGIGVNSLGHNYAPLVEGLGIDKRTKFRGGGFGQRGIAQHDLRKALGICRPRHRRKIVRSAFFRNTRDIAFESAERKRKFPPALPSFKLKQFSRLNHSASANAGASVHRFDKIEQIVR